MSEEPDLNESFAELLIHLGQLVALYLGDLQDPSGQHMDPQPEHAAHFIEMLAMLQEKTRGNLTESESRALESLLYEVRMRFVDAQETGGRRIIEP